MTQETETETAQTEHSYAKQEQAKVPMMLGADSELKPFRLKSDCAKGGGVFKIGETIIDPPLDIVIVGAELMSGKFFGYPETDWGQLLFVETAKAKPMTLMIKMASLRNLINLVEGLRYVDAAIDAKVVNMSFKQKNDTEGNEYYVIVFKATDKPISKEVSTVIDTLKNKGLAQFFEEHLEMEVKYKGGRRG